MAHGTSVDQITSLADLVEPEAFTTILRHYRDQAGAKPNAFVVGIATTLLQVARYHTDASDEHLNRLKRLIYLPDTLLRRANDALETPLRCFVDAQVAIAIAILLVAPVRPKNLTLLNWGRHFSEPDGPKGRLRLRIPKEETKTGKRELVFEIPDEVAALLRWYRRKILPHLNADEHGDLFVTAKGTRKGQDTFTDQIIDRIEAHVGVHMTPHQFRHFAAKLNLDAHPEDFRTVTDLLNHASAKSTQIYAGRSSQRASRAYGKIVMEQREALKLTHPRRKKKEAPKLKRPRSKSRKKK